MANCVLYHCISPASLLLRLGPTWATWSSDHATCDICYSYTVRYMYPVATVHLAFFRALQVSCPTPGITSEHLTCRVCVRAYTNTHNTYTSTACKKKGTQLLHLNKSLTLQTSANHRPDGKILLLTFFYIRMQWCSNLLWVVPKSPVEHTYAKRRWLPQNESKRWLRRQAQKQHRAGTHANVDGPAPFPSVRQWAGTSGSSQSFTQQSPSLLPNLGLPDSASTILGLQPEVETAFLFSFNMFFLSQKNKRRKCEQHRDFESRWIWANIPFNKGTRLRF